MAKLEFHMPDIGEGLAEVEIVEWFVSVGEEVEENQKIADVETDKAIVSMPAPATGRIIDLAAAEGERIQVGSLLLVMEVAGEALGVAGPQVAATDAAGPPLAAATPSTADVARGARQTAAASPAARRLARELRIDIDQVEAAGPRGRITPEDVRRHAELLARRTEAPAGPSEAEVEVEEVPFRGIRRRIAEILQSSYRKIPHVAGFHEFVVAELVEEYQRLTPEADAQGLRLTYLAFILRATALSLTEHPYLNCSLDEERQLILLKKTYNLGVAIAGPKGLLVPVLRNADKLSLFEIARELERLGKAVEDRTITPGEMRGGTFTISNVGAAGGHYGTSLIREPEVAILGLGRIQNRAVVVDGEVVARSVLPVSLTFDHRVVDGDQALAFVRTLRHHLEDNPAALSEP